MVCWSLCDCVLLLYSGWRPNWMNCFGPFLNAQWVCTVPGAFNASPLSPGAPRGGKVAAKRVEKEHYVRNHLKYAFPPKWICVVCFSPSSLTALLCVLFAWFLFLCPFLPSLWPVLERGRRFIFYVAVGGGSSTCPLDITSFSSCRWHVWKFPPLLRFYRSGEFLYSMAGAEMVT